MFRVLTSAGITLQNEIDMLKLARELDMVTVGAGLRRGGQPAAGRRGAARHLLLPRRHDQGRPEGLRLGRDDRGDRRAHGGGEPEAAGAEEGHHPGRARRRDGDARGRAVHARPHHLRRLLDRLVHRAPARSSGPCRSRPGRSRRCASRTGSPMPKVIAVLATLDTKGQEAEFLREQLKALGSRALVVDMGVLGTPAARADVTRAEVARAGGTTLAALKTDPTREASQPVMAAGATKLLLQRMQGRHGPRRDRPRRPAGHRDLHDGDARAALRPAEGDGLDRRLRRHLAVRRHLGHHDDVLGGRHPRPQRLHAQGAGQRRRRGARHGAGEGRAGEEAARRATSRSSASRTSACSRRARCTRRRCFASARLRGDRVPRGRHRRPRDGADDAPGHHRRRLRLRDGRDQRRAVPRPARRRPGAADRGRRRWACRR